MADNTDDLIISISTDQATLRRSIKRIESDLGTLAGSVKKQFDGVGKSIDSSLTTSLQNRINGMVGIGTSAAKEWTGALADQGKELERLRARYSPLFATINSYKATVADIRRAHAVGAISANEMAAAISKERQAALASTAAIKGRNAALAQQPGQSGASGYTSNIAAQFQDIGVTAAMGMSPLQVALQQGTQLSAVFNDLQRQGQGVGSVLASAFMSVVSPVSLVTIGVVAASVAAIQYFSSVISGGNDSSAKLKEQAQLIQSVAEKWGDAVPALREYADQLTRTQNAADLKQGVTLINEKTLENVKKQIGDARVSIAALVQDLVAAGEKAEVIKALQTALNQFVKSADEGKLKTEEVKSVQDALAAAISSTGIPALKDFATFFDTVSSSALSAAGSVQKVNDAAGKMLPESTWRSYNKQTGKLETNAQPWDENIQNPGFTTPEVGPIPGKRPLRELDAPDDQKKQETASQRAANAYRDLKKSADDRLAQMQQEIGLLGKFGIEADTARFALDLLQQSEDKGRSLSDAQRKELAQKVELYRQYSDQLAKTKLQQDLLDQRRYNSMTSQDQQVYTTLKQYGLPTDMNSGEAGQIRQSQQLERQNDAIDQFASSLSSGIVNSGGDIGKAFGQTFLSALQESAQKQLANVLGQLFKAIMTGGGGGSPIGSSATALGGGLLSSVIGGGSGKSAGGAGSALGFVGNYKSGVDPRLTDILSTASSKFPGFKVDAMSGFRAGDPRFHGKGLATDVQLTDLASGKLLGNYQDATSFRQYEQFAQTARQVQMAKYPELADQFRWGGYFGGAKGKYGAVDQMHFDLGGAGMAGGSWNGGLTSAQAAMFPGIKSEGMGSASAALEKLAGASGSATKGLDTLGGGLGKLGSSLGSINLSPGSGGAVGQYGGLWGGIGKIFGGISPTSSLWAPNTTLSAVLGLADGGDVRGPGSGTSDSIPAMLSDGEFVVNAASTRKHRALLHAINNGRVGRFADGGLVGRSISAPMAPTLRNGRSVSNDNRNPGVMVIHIDGANGDDHVMTLAKQAVTDGLGQFNKSQERGGFGTVQGQFTKRKG